MLTDAQRLALSEPDIFQDHEKVHEIFTWMRNNEPVAFCPENYGGKGFWSITKYDDIQEISKNPQLFSSDSGIVLEEPEMRRVKEGRDPEDRIASGRRREDRCLSRSRLAEGRPVAPADPTQ